MSGGKRLGNADMWFAAIWLLIERGHLPWLSELLPFVREQMVWRLRHRWSTAAMTGFPGFVQRRVPLGCAFWFVLASPAFRIQPEVSFDPLRMHLMHPNYLMQLLDLVHYPLPEGIKRHVKRLRGLFSLLNLCKWKPLRFRVAVSGIYQKLVTVNRRAIRPGLFPKEWDVPMYVPVDGPPTENQWPVIREGFPRRCRGLSPEEVVGLSALCKPSLSASAIPLPLGWRPPPLPAPAVEWPAYEGKVDRLAVVKVCPSTCRPYQHMRGTRKTWFDLLREIVDVRTPADVFSGHAWYGRFVCTYHRYPNVDELLVLMYNKFIVKGKRKSFMRDVRLMLENVIANFAAIAAEITPEVFAWRFKRSVRLVDRVTIEKNPPEYPDPVKK
jgi:hypothetical protein